MQSPNNHIIPSQNTGTCKVSEAFAQIKVLDIMVCIYEISSVLKYLQYIFALASEYFWIWS